MLVSQLLAVCLTQALVLCPLLQMEWDSAERFSHQSGGGSLSQLAGKKIQRCAFALKQEKENSKEEQKTIQRQEEKGKGWDDAIEERESQEGVVTAVFEAP